MSSSAQLSLLPWLLRWDPVDDRTSFAAGLHAGSALGIAAALRPTRVPVVATVPAAVVGYLGQGYVESKLGRPRPTAALLATAGVALALADRRPSAHPTTRRDITVAGLAQVASLAPGVSRSGVTITALRLRGVDRQDALRTSLLMSLPVTLGAAGLTAARSRRAPAAVPTLIAAGASYLTARRVSGASSTFLSGSALYRLGLAAVVGRRLLKEKR